VINCPVHRRSLLTRVLQAIIPKDAGGPMGQRIGVSVAGGSGWGLRVMAYKTERTNKSDWHRFSITVRRLSSRPWYGTN
jgi:hypothetical protein